MPFRFEASDNSIQMACGDTANIFVDVEWDRLNEGDVLLFAVFDKSTGEDLLLKPVEIENGTAKIRLCNHDTRDLEAGRYKWNLRLVTSPARDEQGNVIADECSDDVVTVFDDPPNIRLTKGGARV